MIRFQDTNGDDRRDGARSHFGASASRRGPRIALKLESIDVQTLSGQQVQLKLHLSGPAPEPLPFTIDKPARIAFDLPNTTLALASRRIDVRSGGVDTVLAAEANGRTRVVVNVDSLLPYTTKVDGNTIIVTLGQPAAATRPAERPQARTPAPAKRRAAVERAIRTIDFRRGADGTGRVIVQLTDPRTPVNVRQEGNQIVVDFAGTLMPKNLMRRYDVMDFATPVQTVDALRVEGSSRLVITAQGDFEQLAYQSDNQYTVEIKPSPKRADAEEKKEYTGERLTLEFPGYRRALGIAAAGRHQRPEHRRQRFGHRQSDPAAAERALGPGARHRAAHQGSGQAPPGQRHHHRSDGGTRVAREGRARGAQGSAGARRRRAPNSCRSTTPRWRISQKLIKTTECQGLHAVAARQPVRSTSAPIPCWCRTRPDKLADIRRLVQTLDVPVKQVLIEARIVIVSDTFERDLGARFGVTSRAHQRQQRPAGGHRHRHRARIP